MKYYFTLLVFLILGQINAQIVTDRPDQTESASTVGKGNLQIETGIQLGYEGEGEFSSRQIVAPTTLFRYGVASKFEIRIVSQFEKQNTGSSSIEGISDLELGFKLELHKNETKDFEIAFMSHLLFPSGTLGVGSEDYGSINKLAITKQVSEDVGIGGNIGYDYFGIDKGNLTYSLALAVGINDKAGIYIEPYGEFQNFEEFILNFDAGFTYLATPNLQFDLSFGTGVNQKMNYIAMGFSWLLLKPNP